MRGAKQKSTEDRRMGRASRVVCLACLALLAVSSVLADSGQNSPFHLEGRVHLSTGDIGYEVEIWSRGDVYLARDFSEIESLGKGSWFKIRERDGFVVRSVRISSGRDGEFRYQFAIMGLPRRFGTHAREWLDELLPRAMGSTGYGARARSQDLLSTEGLGALLEEAPKQESDYLSSIYYETALEDDATTVEQRIDVARHLTRALESNYYRFELLEELLEDSELDGSQRTALYELGQEIESEHYRWELLSGALENESVGDLEATDIARWLAAFDSEYYQRELLPRFLRSDGLDAEARTTLYRVGLGWGAEYYKTELMSSVLPELDEDAQRLELTLEALQALDSDHYRLELTNQLLEHFPHGETVTLDDLLPIVDRLDSAYSRHELLGSLVPLGSQSPAATAKLLSSCAALDTPAYQAEIVEALLETTLSTAQLDAVRSFVESELAESHYGRELEERIRALP